MEAAKTLTTPKRKETTRRAIILPPTLHVRHGRQDIRTHNTPKNKSSSRSTSSREPIWLSKKTVNLVVCTAKDAITETRWKGGKNKYYLVAALNIKNAFNSDNWDCVMWALEEKNVPGY